jgi:hypothetical protein
MSSTADNGDDSSNTSSTLLKDADELAKSRNWTRDFALYVMYSRAMVAGDKIRAESCMNLLKQEFRNSLGTDYEDASIF